MNGKAGQSGKEPIAIVGMSCRFPGADTLDGFWRLLCEGRDAVTEIPAERWDIDALYDPDPTAPGKMLTRYGSFLKGLDQFDASFFGISPREAAHLDPRQRLMLELAWEGLEDAGAPPDSLAGSRTGVFIATLTDEYAELLYRDINRCDIYTGLGSAHSIVANRISYFLDLRGPSLALDTACSGSLIATHLACQSLWSGESSLALVGGVSLNLLPYNFIFFSKARALAPDGRCKSFDARADGYGRGDGAGIVVLKPLSRALADGDRVYAVIRSSAVNQDGRSEGITAPSRQAQEELLREAYRQADVSPGEVQYIESHGSGTPLSDPVEAQALTSVLKTGRSRGHPCVLGAVKTNVGHLEAAAGVAGLIKAALSIHHRLIPPNLNFEEPNPRIPFDELPLVVPQDLGPWPVESKPLIAGVSSFGVGGANAHVVLEEASHISRKQPDLDRTNLLTLSAHTPEALEDMARGYLRLLDSDTGSALQDICYTANCRRPHFEHRLALTPQSRDQCAAHLEAFLQGETRPGLAHGRPSSAGRPKLAFVFSGQGGQWLGMGRELFRQEPAFKDSLEVCDQAVQRHAGWSIIQELMADESQSRLGEMDVVQPLLFAVQVGLAALWRSWGVIPDAVVGQSVGEVAAAHVAGALSLDDAAQVVVHRSRLLKTTSGQGGMAVAALPLAQAELAIMGFDDLISVAGSHSPNSSVLSGDPDALARVLESLDQRDVFCRMVKGVDVASHSIQMEPLREKLIQTISHLQARPASTPIFSTVTGDAIAGEQLGPEYWGRNLREPFLLGPVVKRLIEEGYDAFLEISPHPVLGRALLEGLQALDREGAVLPSTRRDERERETMLGSLGTLYTVGWPIDWSALYEDEEHCTVSLPTYPWQRERYWFDQLDEGEGAGVSLQPSKRPSVHPLLGEYFRSALPSGEHFWEMDLGAQSVHYLDEHRVQGAIVLPASAYVEMVLAAAAQALGESRSIVKEVDFSEALYIPENGLRRIQLALAPAAADGFTFQILSTPLGAEGPKDAWTLHASGRVHQAQGGDPPPDDRGQPFLAEVRARCSAEVARAAHYESMRERGLEYGTSFQAVERIWRRDGEALASLRISQAIEPEADLYQIHPVLLDAGFQVVAAAAPAEDADPDSTQTYLPVGMEAVSVYDRPASRLWCHAALRSGAPAQDGEFEADLSLFDEDGRIVARIGGLRLQRLEGESRVSREDVGDWLYELQWQPKPLPEARALPASARRGRGGRWLILADGGGVGQALAASLEERGGTCITVSADKAYRVVEEGRRYRLDPSQSGQFRQLLGDVWENDSSSLEGIVHLWSLDLASSEDMTAADLEKAELLGCGSVLHLVQALARVDRAEAPRLWLVTQKAQGVGEVDDPVDVAQAPLWGLGRVICSEQPDLNCTMVDVGLADASQNAQALVRELGSNDGENQIVLRDGGRYAPRLTRYRPRTVKTISTRVNAAAQESPFRLELLTPGVLDSLTLRAMARRRPGAGQVEIQVRAAGLNFKDVMLALGILPGPLDDAVPLGFECAGVVAALGEGVEGFEIGDEVIASSSDCFATHVMADAHLVQRKPVGLSFTEAAMIPVAFGTSYYALYSLARLAEGERVLIHTASGGLGLAAVQLAQLAGAEIFATAGTPEKRAFLESLGIRYVMDSRSLDFAAQIMDITDGQGVDVVLNTLAGEAVDKGLAILRTGGRFLELGKTDIYQGGSLRLQPFDKNLSFFAIDASLLARERPDFLRSVMEKVGQYFEDGLLKPLPMRVFPIADVASAFRRLAEAKHIGKLVVSFEGEEKVSVAPSAEFRPDGAYLIVGGLGGLGLMTAQWMVQRGARHLVLMGRSGASASAQETVESLEQAGAQVMIARGDVTQERQVAQIIDDIRRSMPPLRGVVHSALVLDDAPVLQMDWGQFRKVTAPKAQGAWNLHKLSLDAPLDFFVLFSSAASLFGTPAQGNYSAANAFLDALAHYRRGRGLAAQSINWGMWAQVGIVARQNLGRQLVQRGMRAIPPESGLLVLEQLIQENPAQVAVMRVDWQRWRGAPLPMISELVKDDDAGAVDASSRGFVYQLRLHMDPQEQLALLESYLGDWVARVLRLDRSELDPEQPLTNLGLDSIMAVELKNRIETSLDAKLSMADLLKGSSVAQLAEQLLPQLQVEDEELVEILTELEQLSTDEIQALLGDELTREIAHD